MTFPLILTFICVVFFARYFAADFNEAFVYAIYGSIAFGMASATWLMYFLR